MKNATSEKRLYKVLYTAHSIERKTSMIYRNKLNNVVRCGKKEMYTHSQDKSYALALLEPLAEILNVFASKILISFFRSNHCR